MEVQQQQQPTSEGVEMDQAADALLTMGMKVEKQQYAPGMGEELGKIIPLSSTKEPLSSPEKLEKKEEPQTEESENDQEQDETTCVSKHAYCSSCMKLIPNPISDGHGIVDGHVGQFRMLIPWKRQPDGCGVLCSRCYQRNWRLNKQRGGSSSGLDMVEEIPREPYKCLCGMTFHSSQLKAAHCRLCQKYRDIADQEQRHEGSSSPPRPRTARDCVSKRPRTISSDYQRCSSPIPEGKKENIEEFVSPPPPPIKIRNVFTPPPTTRFPSSLEKINTTPHVKSTPVHSGNVCMPSVFAQKLQLAQLVHTTRLLGQIDIVQYANLIELVRTTTDPTILAEITQLVLQFALKPLMVSQQFIGNPPCRTAQFDAESKPLASLTLLPSIFKFPVELQSHSLPQPIK